MKFIAMAVAIFVSLSAHAHSAKKKHVHVNPGKYTYKMEGRKPADAELKKLTGEEDGVIHASLVEDFSTDGVPDKKLEVRVVSVYRGAAWGFSSYLITFLDNSPSEGDYAHTTLYEDGPYIGSPKKVKLKPGATANTYDLTYKTFVPVDIGDSAKGTKEVQVKIVVKLDSAGKVESAVKQP